MLKKTAVACVALFVLCVAYTAMADKKELKATCPVSGKPAKESAAVDYKGGKVYFCCGGCPAAFEKDTAKFAAKANQQLVATGQAKQIGCPFSGRKLNPDTATKIGDVDVCFCCNNCKGKATAASGDEQINLVFADKSFDKGFKTKTKEKEKKE
jgi:YHS domain-containing protein